jgi:hypothetical protein
VLEKWIDSAMNNDDISGIGLLQGGCEKLNNNCFVHTHEENALKLRRSFVVDRINQIDSLYGRTLGCRVNPVLKQYISQDNHLLKRVVVENRRQEKEQKKRLLESSV